MATLPAELAFQIPRAAQSGAPGDTVSALAESLVRDSLPGAAGALRDTITPPPLPGGVATVFRFLFQVPQWVQIAGALVGALVALWVLRWGWRHRQTGITWLRTRRREVQLGLAGGVLVGVIIASFLGLQSWNYMMHENDFCSGCHVMNAPFQKFATGAGKHEKLNCHDCHQQGMYASMRQLVLWVAERPEKIGTHSPVPNARCAACHMVAPETPGVAATAGRERWQHVQRLAGHRVHFESDSTALDTLACVTCHGAEVHSFVPSTRTCSQSGCHEKQPIKLAHMTKLPEISCVTCHAFKADLPGLATRDSAVRTMVPAEKQCLSCHQMANKLAGYNLAKDPHQGSCGSCHDVHADLTPADAKGSCKNCHADLSRSPFHDGASHRRVQSQCVTCHIPHAAAVDASDCVSCHTAVRKRGQFKAPLPFDTNTVLRRRVTLEPVVIQEHRGKGDELPEELPPPRDSPAPAPAALLDSFPHPRHATLPCLTCHLVNRPSGPSGGLTFQAPRGCDLCHHQKVIAGQVEAKDCQRCHRQEKLTAPQPVTMAVRVGLQAPLMRPVGFRHDSHNEVTCAECHRPSATAPPDSVRFCQACHQKHHVEARDCAQCHNRAQTPPAHSRANHVRCDACHTPSRIAALVPARNFCLTCHTKQRDHYPVRECSPCHFLETPAEFRRHLMRGNAG